MAQAYVAQRVTGASLRALNYVPELDHLRQGSSRVRSKGWKHERLGALVSELGKAYARVLLRVDCAAPEGDELLSQVDAFASEPAGRRIRGDLMPFVEDLRIRRGDILIAGAGQIGESTLFGRALIADDRLVGKLAAGDLMVLRFEDPIGNTALYTYAFLLTRPGLRSVRATAYGTSIPRMRPDLLADLPVPLPDVDSQKRVAALVRSCMEQRERYRREMVAARRVIEELPDMQNALTMCREKAARIAVWDGPMKTLSAWNFASVGAALGALRRSWSGRLRDTLQTDGVFNGPRFARVECSPPHGIDFYSQRDVFLMRPAPRRIARPAIPDRLLFVPQDAVIAGSHGQLTDGGIFGRVELASFGAHRGGLTQDLLRLLFKSNERATAFTFLSTRVGERLLKSTAVGTSIPSMRLDLLTELPYPELTANQRGTVTNHVQEAERARIEAGEAETEAIRIIEEEILPAWLT